MQSVEKKAPFIPTKNKNFRTLQKDMIALSHNYRILEQLKLLLNKGITEQLKIRKKSF